MKILIIEDHYKINELLAMFARSEGYQVKQTYDAETAIQELSNSPYDLIITDLMLPNMQGEELICQLRKISDIYIIVVSAKGDVSSRIDVLQLGADDFITKPFRVEEVMAKLHNVNKRIKIKKPSIVSFYEKELVISLLNREVVYQGKIIEFTKYEFDILMYLIQHKNQICSRGQVFASVFPNSNAYDRVIDAHIKNIRSKLQDESKHSRYIKTHYGLGYQFVGRIDDDI